MAGRFWQLVAAGSPGDWLKKSFLRLSGARIGHHVRIRRGSYIVSPQITLGDGVVIEPNVHVVCGRFELGTECKIDSETVVYGEGSLIMGDGAYIGPRAWINTASTVRLGRNTGIGPGSMIFTHGIWLPYLTGYPRSLDDVTLGDMVWVPAGVTILPGVRIGDGAMVGAGAVVTKDVGAGMFVAGVPAKEVGTVAALMAPSTPERLDARAREMLDGFVDFAGKMRWGLREGSGPLRCTFGTKGSPRTAIAYFSGAVTPVVASELRSLRGRVRRVIVLALGGFEATALDSLGATEWVDWFDLGSSRAKSSWDRDTVAFRRYLASHWGMRFTLSGAH